LGEREVPACRVSCVVCGVVRAGPGRAVSGVGPGEGLARRGGPGCGPRRAGSGHKRGRAGRGACPRGDPVQWFPGESWAGEKL
jgi:hypothetical protein